MYATKGGAKKDRMRFMKKSYISPEVEVLVSEPVDIFTLSSDNTSNDGDLKLPFDPFN